VVLEVLGDELERLSDPRLGFVTLTGVEVTADLREATVYYSSLGGDGGAPDAERAAATAAALASASSHLQSALGRQVRMRYVPRLRFEEDPAIARGQRVEEILREIHRREGS
jgi:ribosome-binding factor A